MKNLILRLISEELSSILKMPLYCNPTMKYTVYSLTKKANELIEKAKILKASEADEIKVELLGEISTKNDDKIFWDKKFKISRIISISLGKEKQKTIILGEN